MEKKAGRSEVLEAGIGRVHPDPGCFLLLLSGSGLYEVASSLPTLFFMICLLCYAPQNRSGGEPWAEHCTRGPQ